MRFQALISIILCMFPTAVATAQQNPDRLARPGTAGVADRFVLPDPAKVQLGGLLGDRFTRNERNRLLYVDEEELLAGFRHRPGKQAWIGEHVGKWLHAASLAYANTGDKDLRAKLDRVVRELLKTQEADGYLGTYVPGKRFGLFPDADWDVWVHKYDLLGLLAYYQYTGDRAALDGAERVGALLVNIFGPGKKSINSAGTHVGMAATSVMEPIVLLYRATGNPKYLDFAKYVVAAWEEPNGPHILTALQKTGSVRKTANAKAYEMLSNLNGLCELYRATGDKTYLDAVLAAWSDIVKNRLYITGSGSAGEHWQDEGHFPGGESASICETCVTVTWEQLNIQLLRLLGEARFVDQLERSVYNHLLGAQKPTGDAWCYYTPLYGKKPYGSSTNCCLSSGPRGVALLPTFAYAAAEDGVAVNLYTAGKATVRLQSRGELEIVQETTYPVGNTVSFKLTPRNTPPEFTLYLRTPAVPSLPARITLNGAPYGGDMVKGTYTAIRRRWKAGDTIELKLRAAPNTLAGDGDTAGKAAFLFGPLVLAADEGHNPELRPLQRVTLVRDALSDFHLASVAQSGEPIFEASAKFQPPGSTEQKAVIVRLVPFYAAGQDGSRFAVWLRRAGEQARTGGSLFYLADESRSRPGNQGGEITDDDPSTFRVTFDNSLKSEDWYAVSLPTQVEINRVVFAHGHCFHDGGWFDTSAGKPRIEARTVENGPWKEVGVLESYPDCTATTPGRGLRDGATFTVKFPSISVIAIRIIGKPASGDKPNQSFSSCAELQGYLDR